jgi:hypothetical protein
MIRKWTEYESGPRTVMRDRVHVTLNPRGVILLNGKAYEMIGSPEAVVLLYDERYSVIGLNPATGNIRNAFPLAQKGNHSHRLIYGSGFCRRFGLNHKKTIVFKNVEVDQDGILQLDLHKATEVE